VRGEMADEGLNLEGVAKRFGRRWALRGVSLEVPAGAAYALMGHNGSGKTTLLRIVATTLRPTRGKGRVLGHDLSSGADAIREEVGALYHAAGVYGDLTARENLEFSRRMWGGRSSVGVDEALERVGLTHAAEERAAGFSSGMTRRLALARLVMRPPKILLLDEPYASFDTDGIELVNQMVVVTVRRGGLVLIATHDPERSNGVVDGVITLQDGRLAPPATVRPRLHAEATG
jgi:heme exporter protein A